MKKWLWLLIVLIVLFVGPSVASADDPITETERVLLVEPDVLSGTGGYLALPSTVQSGEDVLHVGLLLLSALLSVLASQIVTTIRSTYPALAKSMPAESQKWVLRLLVGVVNFLLITGSSWIMEGVGWLDQSGSMVGINLVYSMAVAYFGSTWWYYYSKGKIAVISEK